MLSLVSSLIVAAAEPCHRAWLQLACAEHVENKENSTRVVGLMQYHTPWKMNRALHKSQ